MLPPPAQVALARALSFPAAEGCPVLSSAASSPLQAIPRALPIVSAPETERGSPGPVPGEPSLAFPGATLDALLCARRPDQRELAWARVAGRDAAERSHGTGV